MSTTQATTLRWLIDNRWGDKGSLLQAQSLIDEIVGFPAPGRTASVSPASTPDPVPVVDWQADESLPVVKDVVWRHGPGKQFPIVGVGFTFPEFRAYLAGISDDAMTWKPTGITLHHTAAPSLAQRPQGFLPAHMDNLRSYYMSLGWSRGPHLFVDDHRIWVFSPLTARGTHAVAFNSTSFGVEMLGNYDSENPKSGRGLAVCTLAAQAVVALRNRFVIKSGIQFHRDDPATSKSCPGRLVTKDWFNTLPA